MKAIGNGGHRPASGGKAGKARRRSGAHRAGANPCAAARYCEAGSSAAPMRRAITRVRWAR
ncbi:hypothetical protein B7760_00006 [Burkholderia glumae]|nr:hypothetical protein B7760_00006 [Burkholderia glumae]